MKNIKIYNVVELNNDELTHIEGGNDIINAINWCLGYLAGSNLNLVEARARTGMTRY
jgi:bacteriocin-like protein